MSTVPYQRQNFSKIKMNKTVKTAADEFQNYCILKNSLTRIEREENNLHKIILVAGHVVWTGLVFAIFGLFQLLQRRTVIRTRIRRKEMKLYFNEKVMG